MHIPPESLRAGQCPVPHHSSPVHTDHDRVRLYTPEFATDPHRAYREMRDRYGSIVPVELAPGVPATLVVGYRVAVRILHDPDHFPADPRAWQRRIDPGCPVLPILAWRPNALRSAGVEHERYRRAATAGIDGVDLHRLHDTVERIAIALIETFRGTGAADLLRDYAAPLAFQAINALLGCPPEIGNEIATATAAIFEGVDTAQADLRLAAAMLRLIEDKRAEPGDDITSRLIAHPAAFTDEELIHQLGILYGAGTEPTLNLITNSLLLMLTDDRFAGSMLDGSLSTRDALDEVLFHDPPMANFSVTYPRQPVLIDNTWLPADQPVVIGLAACNNDPEIGAGPVTGNRSHLAWGAGPHACPARDVASLIAQDAVDQLLDALPELRLAVPVPELSWRPGPFHRALAALPVVFTPSPS
ncbi:cytochrome P450 [Nocardia cyriacigeorgica]|uniref:cytochrome P450 n=1 Tax=Nocardia cyriacigeorgica TaxID=135487 RepID=UPI00245868C0|nr:cytochrome P450 [Nocardia cyriacigeorgica]